MDLTAAASNTWKLWIHHCYFFAVLQGVLPGDDHLLALGETAGDLHKAAFSQSHLDLPTFTASIGNHEDNLGLSDAIFDHCRAWEEDSVFMDPPPAP